MPHPPHPPEPTSAEHLDIEDSCGVPDYHPAEVSVLRGLA